MAVALITGASSGLGAALAVEMGRRGHAVGLVARRADRLEDVRGRLEALGAKTAVVAADVTDFEALQDATRALVKALGPIDIMVANAGVEGQFSKDAIDVERIRRTFDVNVFGAIHGVKAVLPGMLERRSGHLVVVSSVAANRGLPKSAPYSSSKAAITIFWEGLRVDLVGTGVSTTVIHPGFVKTEMTASNDFAMPFLLDPDVAARQMADAIEARRAHLTFPWQMRWVERLMRRIPNRLFDRLVSRAR